MQCRDPPRSLNKVCNNNYSACQHVTQCSTSRTGLSGLHTENHTQKFRNRSICGYLVVEHCCDIIQDNKNFTASPKSYSFYDPAGSCIEGSFGSHSSMYWSSNGEVFSLRGCLWLLLWASGTCVHSFCSGILVRAMRAVPIDASVYASHTL